MSGAGLEPDHAIAFTPVTVPIGNYRSWLFDKINQNGYEFNPSKTTRRPDSSAIGRTATAGRLDAGLDSGNLAGDERSLFVHESNADSGARLAQTVSNNLMTDVVGCRALGSRILAGQYTLPIVKSLTLPLYGDGLPYVRRPLGRLRCTRNRSQAAVIRSIKTIFAI